MNSTTVNSNFEYRSGKVIVSLKGTIQKRWLIEALKDGLDGISGATCPLTGERISFSASPKLKQLYDKHWQNYQKYTPEEIEEFDKI